MKVFIAIKQCVNYSEEVERVFSTRSKAQKYCDKKNAIIWTYNGGEWYVSERKVL